jgi:hypothetical protein
LDDDDLTAPAYQANHKLWTVEIGPRRPLGALYNDFFADHGGEAWYGFICDDVVPETPGWDWSLIERAGNDGMAVPSGGHEDYVGSPHFVLGGDLVRSIGWLALPGLDRIFIDTVWEKIAEKRGVLRFTSDVVLTHYHFSNGKALMDATYRKHHKTEDRAIYESWRAELGASDRDRRL